MDFFILYRLGEELLGSGSVEGVVFWAEAVATAATPVTPMASLKVERRDMSCGIPQGAVNLVFIMGIELRENQVARFSCLLIRR